MKKFNLFVMAALSATYSLTSCSSDEPIDSEPVNVDQTVNSKSYLSVNLHLADMTSTRASFSYDDGEDYEYALNSAFIYIYQKDASSGRYLLDTKGELKTTDNTTSNVPNSPTGDVLSGDEERVAQLDGFEADPSKTYYVLVLANRPDDCPDPEGSLYFDDWASKMWNEIKASYGEDNGIYMANALLTTSMTDEKVAPSVLVEVSGDEFKTTQELAEQSTGVSVCIERSCAKLTVKESDGDQQYWGEEGGKLGTSSYYAGTVKLLDYGVHNYNTVSFPIHTLKVEGYDAGISTLDEQQMHEATSDYFYNKVTLGSGDKAEDFYSVNWSYTPRYNQHTQLMKGDSQLDAITEEYPWATALASGNLSSWTQTAKNVYVPECYARPYEAANKKGLSDITYVSENCQEFSGMHKGETTAVVLHGQWTPSQTTGSGEDAEPAFTTGESVIVCNGALYTDDGFKKAIKDACPDYSGEIDLEKLSTLIQEKQGGIEALTDEVVKGATEAQLATINETLNAKADGGILRYKNGECYYTVYLRHFTDSDLGTSYSKSYKLADLGRYGLVRNHWYQLQVTNINLPGTPYIPSVTPHDPDDNPNPIDPTNPDPGNGDDDDDDDDEEVDTPNYYLNVNIQEMSWAKRTNSLKF